MGLFDSILGRKGGSGSTRPDGSVSADRVQEEYHRLVQAKKQPPGTLLVRMGDIHRDLGDKDRAGTFYEEAAEQFAREESWSLAEATVRRVTQINGSPTNRTLLCQLEIGLGRRMAASAIAAIEALSKRLKPSDGTVIERMVEIVDQYAMRDGSLEIAFSEFLFSVGRPERGRERLQIAKAIATARNDERLLQDVKGRLGSLGLAPRSEPMGATYDSQAPHRQAPSPASVEPPSEPPRKPTPSGAAVRLIGTDGRTDGRDDENAVRELIRQLRAGLDEHLSPEDADAHFDLGFAFLEMRLYDEAVHEFSMAFRSDEFRVRAAQGLAQALIESGSPDKANEVLTSVRPEIGGGEAAHGLIYWHARAHEAEARTDEALALYQRIAREDPTFQDVGKRIRSLSS